MIGFLARLITALLLSRLTSQKLAGIITKPNKEDLAIIRELMKAGKATPVIDRCYPLTEVSEAIRYLETGHARGKVVIVLKASKKS
jgi:NADPH:quinone reductase-like Zn-dependent oxidoreductase